MTDIEVKKFIDEMNKMGDSWIESDVKYLYGDTSYEAAVQDRTSRIAALIDKIREHEKKEG